MPGSRFWSPDWFRTAPFRSAADSQCAVGAESHGAAEAVGRVAAAAAVVTSAVGEAAMEDSVAAEGTAGEDSAVAAEGTVEEDSAAGRVAVSAVEASAAEVRAAEEAGVQVVEEVTGDSAVNQPTNSRFGPTALAQARESPSAGCCGFSDSRAKVQDLLVAFTHSQSFAGTLQDAVASQSQGTTLARGF